MRTQRGGMVYSLRLRDGLSSWNPLHTFYHYQYRAALWIHAVGCNGIHHLFERLIVGRIHVAEHFGNPNATRHELPSRLVHLHPTRGEGSDEVSDLQARFFAIAAGSDFIHGNGTKEGFAFTKDDSYW